MANTQTETKVIQVRFDNRKFEKNIQATIKSTEKLDKSLQFKGSKKGIEDLSKELDKLNVGKLDKDLEKTDKQLNNISVTLGSLLKIKLLSRAIDVVTSKVGNMLKTMTGINNIKDGWDAYNESLITTGGILNQVERDGYGLEDVANAMDKLRWYADETSYSFQTMSDGIRQFTIAGVDLEKATSAVQGVANLAGSAKVFDPYKVQSAMDAISKSMQTGYMDTLKWTTLTNTAGIVTKDFSEKLLEAAAAEGTLIKSQVGQYRTKKGGDVVTAENIRSTLSRRWLTQEVMTRVLGEYNSATEVVKGFMTAVEDTDKEAFKEISKSLPKVGGEFESLDALLTDIQTNTSKYSEETVNLTKRINSENITTRQAALLLNSLGYEFDEVSYKAFLSSQETTSFGQAISYVSQAIKTTWQGMFQSMFGDVKESTALWSDVSDSLYNIFVSPFENLEEQFSIWSELEEGGAKDFRESILNIVDVLESFTNAAKKGFVEVFGTDFVGVLQKVTKWLKGFTEGLKENQTMMNIIEATSKVIATVLKVIGKVAGGVFKIVSAAFKAIEPVIEGISTVVLWIADGFAALINYLEELGVFEAIFGGIAKIFTAIGNAIKKISNAFKQSKAWAKIGQVLSTAFQGLLLVISKIVDGVVWLIDKIAFLFDATEEGEEKVSGLAKAMDWLRKVFEKLAAPFKKIIEYFKQLDFKAAFKKSLQTIKDTLVNTFGKIKEWFENSKIPEFFTKLKDTLAPVGKVLLDIFHSFIDPLVAAAKAGDIKTILKWLAGVAGVIALILFIKTQFEILYGAGKVLSSIADMFWALESRFKASAIRSWGVLIALIGATILMAVEAFVKIIELMNTEGVTTGKIVGASVIIGALLGAFFASIFMMFKVLDKDAKFGIRSSVSIIAIAGALALALKSVIIAVNIAKDVNEEDLAKTLSIFSIVSIMFAAILAAGRIGTKKLSPMLITYGKIILSIWAFLKLFFWMLDNLSKYSENTINSAVKIIKTVVAGLITIVTVLTAADLLRGLSYINGKWKFNPNIKPKKGGTGLVGQIALMMLGVGVVMLSMAMLTNAVRKMPLSKMPYVIGMITVSLILIGGLAIALTFVDRKLPPPQKAAKTSTKIVGVMFAVSVSVTALMGALAIASLLPGGAIVTGALRIAAIYGAIGLIAALLLYIDKKLAKDGKNLSIGKGGVKSAGFMKSNVGSMILAITVSVAAIVLLLKYVANMDSQLFWEGTGKVLLLVLCVSTIVAGLLAIDKLGSGSEKKMMRPIALVFAMTLLISVIVAALFVISNMLNHPFVAMGVLLGMITAMMTVIIVMVIMAKRLDKNSKTGSRDQNRLKLLMNLMLTITLFIVAAAAALWVISKIPEKDLNRAIIVMGALFVAMGLLIWFLPNVSKRLQEAGNWKDLLFTMAIIAGIEVLTAALIGLIFLASLTNDDMINKAFKAYGSMALVVIAMGVMVYALGKLISDNGAIVLLGLAMMAGIELLVAGLVGVMLLASFIDDNIIMTALKTFGVMLAAIAIMAGLIVGITAINKAFESMGGLATGLVLMLAIELLVAGLVGIMLLTTLITDDQINTAIKLFITMGIVVVALAGVCAALTALAAFVAPGMAVLAGLEILLLGLVGIAALVALVVKSFANNIQKLADALTSLGEAFGVLGNVNSSDIQTIKEIIKALEDLKKVKIKSSFANGISKILKSFKEAVGSGDDAAALLNNLRAVTELMKIYAEAYDKLMNNKRVFEVNDFRNVFKYIADTADYINDFKDKLDLMKSYMDSINTLFSAGASSAQNYANLFNALVSVSNADFSAIRTNLLGVFGDGEIQQTLANMIVEAINKILDGDNLAKVKDSIGSLLGIINETIDENKVNSFNSIFTSMMEAKNSLDSIALILENLANITEMVTNENFVTTFNKIIDIEYLTSLNEKIKELIENINSISESVIKKITKLVKVFGDADLTALDSEKSALNYLLKFFNELLKISTDNINTEASVDALSTFVEKFNSLVDATNNLDTGVLYAVYDILKKLDKKDTRNGVMDVTTAIESMFTNCFAVYEYYTTFSSFVNRFCEFLAKLKDSKDAVKNLKDFVKAIKDIKPDDLNIGVTLTPVWNFDGNFYSGMNMINGIGRTSYESANKAKTAYELNHDRYQGYNQNTGEYDYGAPGMVVNINQELSDFTQGYRVERATKNAVIDAVNGVGQARTAASIFSGGNKGGHRGGR